MIFSIHMIFNIIIQISAFLLHVLKEYISAEIRHTTIGKELQYQTRNWCSSKMSWLSGQRLLCLDEAIYNMVMLWNPLFLWKPPPPSFYRCRMKIILAWMFNCTGPFQRSPYKDSSLDPSGVLSGPQTPCLHHCVFTWINCWLRPITHPVYNTMSVHCIVLNEKDLVESNPHSVSLRS